MVRSMAKFTERVKAILRRPRPVTPVTKEYAAEIADWVNEGGAFDPAGPPPVIDHQRVVTKEP